MYLCLSIFLWRHSQTYQTFLEWRDGSIRWKKKKNRVKCKHILADVCFVMRMRFFQILWAFIMKRSNLRINEGCMIFSIRFAKAETRILVDMWISILYFLTNTKCKISQRNMKMYLGITTSSTSISIYNFLYVKNK